MESSLSAEPESPAPVVARPSAISVRQLSLGVPDRRQKKQTKLLLDQVSFDIAEGTFTAIIGPSGCGKTTLIRVLAGLRTGTAGEVRLAGHEPTALGICRSFRRCTTA